MSNKSLTPTKDELKKWANAPSLQSSQPEIQSGNEASHTSPPKLLQPGELDLKKLRSSRPLTARAIPKVLFTFALVSPVFLIAFLFVNGIKMPSQKQQLKADSVEAQPQQLNETDENTLLRQRLAKADATIALYQRQGKQRSSVKPPMPMPNSVKPIPVVRQTTIPRRVVTKFVVPAASHQQSLRRTRAVISTSPPRVAKPTTSLQTFKSQNPNEYLRQLASADVFGAAALNSPRQDVDSSTLASTEGETSSATRTDVENAAYYPNNRDISAPGIEESYNQSAQLIRFDQSSEPTRTTPQNTFSTPPTLNSELGSSERSDTPLQPHSELEASFLNGQSQKFLKVGAVAQAVLVTPLVINLDERQQGTTEYFTFVLASPLLASDRSVVFPSGTQIVSEFRSLSEGIIQLVGVEAYLEKGNTVQRVLLPKNAIGAIAFGNIKEPKQPKKHRSNRSLVSTVVSRAARSAEVRDVIGGNSNIVADLTSEVTDAAIDELERRGDRADGYESADKQQLYLAAGTTAKVYVKIPFSTSVSVSSAPTVQPDLEPQMGFAGDLSLQRSAAIFKLRNRLRSNQQ